MTGSSPKVVIYNFASAHAYICQKKLNPVIFDQPKSIVLFRHTVPFSWFGFSFVLLSPSPILKCRCNGSTITKFRFSFSLFLKNISLMCPLPPNPSVKFLSKLIKEIQKTCLHPHPCLSKRRILLLVHQLGPPLVSPPAPPWRAMRTSNQGRAVRSKSRLSLPVKTRKQLWY